MSYFWIYRPTLGNCVSSAGSSSPQLCPGSGSLLHAGAAFLVDTSRWGPPSSRCASAIQLVRALESIIQTQPQLQPALARLSAMVSQYFILCRAWLSFTVLSARAKRQFSQNADRHAAGPSMGAV